jgi:hypothetical protein
LAREARQCHFGGTPKTAFQERNRIMREELDGRMWVDHHEQFGEWVDGATATLRAGLARFASWDGSSHQLFAMIAAFAVTALSLTFTNSAA